MRFDAEARRHGEKRGEETEVGKDGQHAFAAVVPGGSEDRRGNRGCEAALLFRPGLDFAAETLVAVLHALFDRGPDLRVAALPFRHGFVPEVGQVGDAHFAGEKAADGEIAEAGEEGGPAAVGGGEGSGGAAGEGDCGLAEVRPPIADCGLEDGAAAGGVSGWAEELRLGLGLRLGVGATTMLVAVWTGFGAGWTAVEAGWRTATVFSGALCATGAETATGGGLVLGSGVGLRTISRWRGSGGLAATTGGGALVAATAATAATALVWAGGKKLAVCGSEIEAGVLTR